MDKATRRKWFSGLLAALPFFRPRQAPAILSIALPYYFQFRDKVSFPLQGFYRITVDVKNDVNAVRFTDVFDVPNGEPFGLIVDRARALCLLRMELDLGGAELLITALIAEFSAADWKKNFSL